MQRVREKSPVERVVSLLPEALAGEIIRLAEGRKDGLSGIKEIRIRRGGVCTLLIGRENLRLFSTVDKEQIDALVDRLLDGALYAHRDSIAEGYISLEGGIRVGICGSAAYDGDRLVGVGNMSSLLFRIPSGVCEFSDELYEIYASGIGSGMLIYSPPGVGKTTALRSLAGMVGGGKHPKRVAIIDRRCEFSEGDYRGCEVDILKGYKRKEGIEIATRTMSPEIVMIDEIGADDAEALIGVIKCGIPLIATAHAASREELMMKRSLGQLFACSVFDLIVGISRDSEGYRLHHERL